MASSSTNPFRFGKIATHGRFCNRVRESADLYQYLSSGKNVWLYSPRRFGKTSLVRFVFERLSSQKSFKTVYVDIFDTKDESSFSLALAKAVANALSDRVEKALDLAKTAFFSLAPKIVLGEDGKPEIQFGISSRSAPEHLLDEVMESIARIVEKKKIFLIIAIDEFQQIAEYEDPEIFQARLRKQIQHQESISYVFLGSQRHLMQEIFTTKKKPFFQSAVPMELGLIAKEELCTSMIDLTRNTIHPFSEPIAQTIAELAEGHPYHTEKLASYCFDLMPSIHQTLVPPDFLNYVVSNIIQQEESIYKNFLKLLTSGQRSVLIAVADYSGKIPSNDMVRKYSLSSRQYLDRTIDFLIKKELIDEKSDGVCIYDIIFRKWLHTKVQKNI